jgi:polyferredoxin
MLLLSVPVFLWAGRWARLAFLVLVVAVLGVLYNQQFAAARVVEIFALDLPPAGNLSLFLLVFGVLALSVAFGQVYCGLLCPFGAMQEILGRLGLLMPVSPELDRRLRFLKHVVLAATVVIALLLGSKRILDYDPLAVAFSFKADTLMWALIGLVLLLSLFFFRFWCRYLCPVGAFLSLFNRVALLRGLAAPKDYRRCDLGARSKQDLDCLHCNRCIHRVTEVKR